MALNRTTVQTSFEAEKVIEPIYSGGAVALANDGRLLVTTLGEDALLTDLHTGQRLAKVEGDGEAITTLTVTPLGSHLIVCSRSLSLRIYALEYLEDGTIKTSPPRTLKAHGAPITTTAIDESGTLLATGSADGTTKIWDIRGAFATHTFHGSGSIVTSLCFFTVAQLKHNKHGHSQGATAGYRLAAGYDDGQIRIWNLETRKITIVLESHTSVVRGLDYNKDRNVLLSVSRDATIILWNASTWKPQSTIPAQESLESGQFLTPKFFVASGESGRLRIWNLSNRTELPSKIDASPSGIIQLLMTSSSSEILAIYADLNLSIFSCEGLSLNATSDPVIELRRRISGTHDEIIDFALVGRDHNHLAIATNVQEIKILSLQASQAGEHVSGGFFGSDIAVLAGHEDIVICLDVDWSGQWLVSGAKDNTIKLWRLEFESSRFDCVLTLTGHAESVSAVALPRSIPQSSSSAWIHPWQHPPDYIISGSQDKTVKRWTISLNNGKHSARAAYTRKAHDKDINALDIDHKSSLFASASQDKTIKIWSTEDGEVTGVLRGHRRGVWSVKFAPPSVPSISSDGNQSSNARGYVLTGSGDKTVKIWSLVDYSCIRTFEGHSNSVLKVVWNQSRTSVNDSRNKNDTELDLQEEPGQSKSKNTSYDLQVASAAGDGLVKVWDVMSGELAATLDNHTDRVWALLTHPSQDVLVSGGGDGVITWWRDTTSMKTAASAAATTARIEEDQRLQNFMRNGSYREAITLALQLNHPARLLALFTAVTSRHPPESDSFCGVKAVDQVIASLSDEQLMSLLRRLRDWNTNAKTAPVAQRILWTIFKIVPPNRLMRLQKSREGGVKDILDALKAYTERHYSRMEELIDESYLLDFTLQEMDVITGITAA